MAKDPRNALYQNSTLKQYYKTTLPSYTRKAFWVMIGFFFGVGILSGAAYLLSLVGQ